jgi:ABC-type nitrate/sulfonate/bicarbonate transport system substrate-binding protein
LLLIAFSAVVASSEVALAQDKVKVRIGTHISISAHLFMQKKPEVLKHMGKSYEVEWVRFAGSGDAMPALVAGKLDGSSGHAVPDGQRAVPIARAGHGRAPAALLWLRRLL